MKSTLAIAAMGTAWILAFSSENAHSDALRKQACSITYPGHPPPHVQDCLINSNMSPQGHVRIDVTTPDGKRFRIENDPHDITVWWLNGRSAEQIQGGSCYESIDVYLCVENGVFLRKTMRLLPAGNGFKADIVAAGPREHTER